MTPNKHTYYFMYTFYEGYTDVSESESALSVQAFNCVMIEGIDYDKGIDTKEIDTLAWKKTTHNAYIYYDEFLIEIKLLGVDRVNVNI